MLAVRPSIVKFILLMIAPGNNPSAMRMALNTPNTMFKEAKSYFDRFSVSLLCIDAQDQGWLSLLFRSFHNLQIFIIKSYSALRIVYLYSELAFIDKPNSMCGRFAFL